MVQDGYLDDEDIFTHPELLADIPNWRDIIEASIAKLMTRGWLQSARHLATVGDELERQALRHSGHRGEPVTRFSSQVAAVATTDGIGATKRRFRNIVKLCLNNLRHARN